MKLRATATFTSRESGGRFAVERYLPGIIQATEDAGLVVLLEAQELVPVDTGQLRESGHVEIRETGKTVVADVIFDAAHAGFVEYGTGIIGSGSPGSGPYPYDPTWLGMPAQPYLRPALDGAKDEMAGMYALRMRE